ncbi:MAG: IS630 family transposase [Oscillospiraceae bacterium]|nr:IS630 family transposase [Oscillospiraceae bacterium]
MLALHIFFHQFARCCFYLFFDSFFFGLLFQFLTESIFFILSIPVVYTFFSAVLKGIRPSVPCHHIREYRYVYGAVEPLTGDSCFLIMPYCNTVCMNLFLEELSAQFPNDIVLLCCDGAAWHKSKSLQVPENIVLFHIPPYTPEMNPIEQIWKEIRKRGFRNEGFATLQKVVDRLDDTICSLPAEVISHITNRNWIVEAF